MLVSYPFKENDRTWVTISELFPNDERTFNVRYIAPEFTTDDVPYLIAGDEFRNAIMDQDADLNNEHDGFRHEPMFGLSGEVVEQICIDADERIFFYTDDTTLFYSDEELLKEMKEENEDFFV